MNFFSDAVRQKPFSLNFISEIKTENYFKSSDSLLHKIVVNVCLKHLKTNETPFSGHDVLCYIFCCLFIQELKSTKSLKSITFEDERELPCFVTRQPHVLDFAEHGLVCFVSTEKANVPKDSGWC